MNDMTDRASASRPGTRRTAEWYFDFISPFAYLQWQSVRRLDEVAVTYRPILFAGLLSHHDHKGPAEIPAKRVFTYRHAQWRAGRSGIPMRFPPAHPFNPLAALRLCIAAGADRDAIDAIFNHIWRDGRAAGTFDDLAKVAAELGLGDSGALQRAEVKQALRDNFDAAIRAGVFGVPTLVVDGILFWGEDSFEMFRDYLADPGLFDSEEMRRVSGLPIGTARRSGSGDHGKESRNASAAKVTSNTGRVSTTPTLK